ncbi:class I adenylate-forming enzyme family protein [Acrocarpospora catenulata]|uniref:class I adenylate-forming enzyme family protein n=1 Tax=Acrocarpospora catenulata TaxID=2836182 RepID=UPI001BD9C76C|nr:AMP-binding protein [Acrocarpospora catenulata]
MSVVLDVRTAMRRSAQFHWDRPAIASDGRQLTFGEVWRRGTRLANALLAAGLEPGDRVAVLEDNCVEAADFYIGSAVANLIRVPLYRRNSSVAHRYMLSGTGCKVAVVAEEYAHEIKDIVDELGITLIVRDSGYEDWLASFPDTDPDPRVELDDAFIIRHSAGTTGRAKGIAYTHRAWMNTTRDWFFMLPPIEPGDRCLHVGPISHGSGYLFLPVWLAGGCNVLDRRFQADGFVERVARDEIGWFFAVPTMIADIVAAVDRRRQDLPSLKAVMISGAPISVRTARAGHEVFGDRLFQMYGQTEAVPVSFMGSKEWFSEVSGSEPIVSAGRVMPFAELEIRDPDNNSLPIGEEGEIAIRCDGQMTGIWGDPELSDRRLRDGWVLTGDIGRLDRNGYLYVVDRVDDMIVSGGFNIWPAELEQAIQTLPDVREVVVFGVPHDKWGEAPMAVVVKPADANLDEGTVIETCTRLLGSYKKPHTVVFRDSPLPRSPVGKIQRKVLREPYWAGEQRRVRGS